MELLALLALVDLPARSWLPVSSPCQCQSRRRGVVSRSQPVSREVARAKQAGYARLVEEWLPSVYRYRLSSHRVSVRRFAQDVTTDSQSTLLYVRISQVVRR